MRSLTLIGLLVAGMVSATSIYAQDLTAQQKFDALAAKGIFVGQDGGQSGSGTFDQEMSRSQFARVAAVLLGLDTTGTAPNAPTFTDVQAGSWYTEQIDTAALAGGVSGEGSIGGRPGSFAPGSVTLEQIAQMVVNVLQLPVDLDASVDGKASGWAAGYIDAAIRAGFFPIASDYTQPATRDQLLLAMSGVTTQEPVPDPISPPDPDLIEELEQTVATMPPAPLPSGAGTAQAPTEQPPDTTEPDNSIDPLAPLVLVDSNIGNELALDQVFQQVVTPMTGTFAGRFDGSYLDSSGVSSVAVGGVLTLMGDFSGSPTMFSATAALDTGGAGTMDIGGIGFDVADPTHFVATGSHFSANGAEVGGLVVNRMGLDGYFSGAHSAAGSWDMTLDNGLINPRGTFTVTNP